MLLQPTTAVTSAQQRPSTREDLASTVLQHVARASPVTTSKRTTGSTTSRWLEPFITVLPCPAPPAVWGDVCADLVSGGGGAFERWVTSACEELPDVHGSAAAHCQVARQPWAHRFNDPQLSAFVAALFLSVVAPPGRATAAWKRLGAPAPLLNRFDLWHGHLFLAHSSSGDTSSSSSPPPCRRSRTRGCGRRQRLSSCSRGGDKEQCTWQASSVGILMHAAEFPAYDSEAFPVNLGNCQVNSTLVYHQRAMDLRNILLWQGNLAVLDVGADSPLHDLLHEGTEPVRTLYEEDFGQPLADVLVLQKHRRRRRCPRAAQRHWQRLQGASEAHAPYDVFVSY